MDLNSLLVFILIGIAGGIGSVLRAWITQWRGVLPYGLISTNSVAAGLVGWWLAGPTLTADYSAVITVGLAGGLSTFSTLAKDSFDFYHRGRIFQAILTMVTNLIIPLAVMMLATQLR